MEQSTTKGIEAALTIICMMVIALAITFLFVVAPAFCGDLHRIADALERAYPPPATERP